MKYRRLIGMVAFTIFSLAYVFPIKVEAISKLSTWTTPFGGRVLSTKIPTVECPGAIGQGTAPVVLSSNLAGLGQATVGATGRQSTLSRVGNIGTGIYRAIPLYTLRLSSTGKELKQPKVGDWILGNQYLIPTLEVCNTTLLGGLPFPVVKTDNYGVSE